MKKFICNKQMLSTCSFSFLFAYILSFPFEGRVLYSLLDADQMNTTPFIFIAIVMHFMGQFSCGLFCKTIQKARSVLLVSMCLCVFLSGLFLIPSLFIRYASLALIGYISGCAVASWGHFLKEFTPKNHRFSTCADVLIFSNIIMIIINVITSNVSIFIGFVLSVLCLLIGILFTWFLPTSSSLGSTPHNCSDSKLIPDIRKLIIILFLFIAMITIDSGLMYQVINPAFLHLAILTSWYWSVPYVVALLIIRNLPLCVRRTIPLYIGIAMIMLAFVSFMFLGRTATDYIIIDTLMLGACGIFDLFWWGIIGETLEYSKNPAQVFGIGLSANVFGVLCGEIIGVVVFQNSFYNAPVTVIALCVVCVTLVILPPLNQQISLLLKSHAYLSEYSQLEKTSQKKVVASIHPNSPLTDREKELLQLLLDGKSNKDIADSCFISENTVKTHLKRIYSKYSVSSRVELFSLLLRSQDT